MIPANRSQTAAPQRELVIVPEQKMILDYDFLPPPMAE
jgi:hypothetical protein